MLTKIKLKTECNAIVDLKNIDKKSNTQRTLDLLLDNIRLSVLEKCALYNQLGADQFAKLNKHRHSGIDGFLVLILHAVGPKHLTQYESKVCKNCAPK